MIIKKAEHMGFCFGVENAVNTAENELKKNGKLTCYGEIIHNDDVIERLKSLGLKIINNLDEILDNKNETILIRSHGVPKSTIDFLKDNMIKFINATCPKVKNIHRIVEKYSKLGYEILVVGDETHPEVQGIIGWIFGDFQVIGNIKDLEKTVIDKEKKYCLVCQTTFNYNILKEIVEILDKNVYTNIIVNNTICDATVKRQNSCVELAKISDVMLVVGGKNSSNTKKLFELSKANCKDTFLIGNYKEIPYKYIDKNTKIGITAGASAPGWVIEEVILNVRESEQNNE